jgi:flagellar hook-associated protein 1
MSTTALNSAVSGLRIAQKALDVTASNVSNASTEGYTRKTLPQERVLADGVGIGVRYGEIQRYVDEAVLRDYRKQLGIQAYQTTRESYLSRIVALHGSTDSEASVSAKLNNVYNEFVVLSADPSSASAQGAVVNAAQKLASTFNNYSSKLEQMRNDVENEIKAEVGVLNGALQNIATLNKSIQNLTNVGRSTAELEDQRDMMVKKVAEQLDISYFKDGNNVLVIQTRDGHVLADTEARPLEFEDTSLNPSLVYPTGANGIILRDARGNPYDIASGETGGKIGALLDMRDKEIPSYNAQIDELAHKMMVRFHDQGLDLFTNVDGLIPGNFPTTYVGLAGKIKVNDLVVADPSLLQRGTAGGTVNPGSNDLIMNVINYTFGKFKDAAGTPNVAFNISGTGINGEISFTITNDTQASLMSFSNAFLDAQAGALNITKDTLTNEIKYTSEVQNRFLESSAVNTDEEMTRMIELQRNYSASAKMISALDELFRDLLNAI